MESIPSNLLAKSGITLKKLGKPQELIAKQNKAKNNKKCEVSMSF